QRLQARANVTWLIGQADPLNRAPLGAFTYFLRPYFNQRREYDNAANQAAFDQMYAGLVTVNEATRADLQTYRSFLAGVNGLVIPGSPYESADEKLRTDNGIAAIKTWVRAISERQPLVIQLEDAQWLDVSSVSAVQQLTYNMEDVPLALVLTSRYNDDGSPLVIPNIYSVPIHSFDLNRLPDEGVRIVAGAVLKGAVSEWLARFVSQRAEGNPFFTEQLTLDLKERSALIETDGVWDMRPDAAVDVPSSVNAVLIARLDRLAAQVKSVVQTAAVLGREFDVQVLSQMLREGERAYIQVAEDEAIWTALDTLRYLFRHALLRDAAYQMQIQERLTTLHRLAAETIETLYPDDVTQYEALLEHWHTSGELDHELRYLDPVVKRLIDITAQYDRAGELLMRAIEPLADSDTRRLMPLNWMSALHLKRGNFAEAEEAAQQARLLASVGNRAALALSLHRLGVIANSRDSYAEGRDYLEQSLAIQQEIDDREGIAANFNSLGAAMQRQGAYAEARAYLEQSLALWREIGDPEKIANSLNQLGVVARMQGQITEARTYIEQSLEIRREVGDRAGIAASLSQLGVVARIQGNYEEAQTLHEQAIIIKREIGDRLGLANSLISVGNISFGLGKFSEARLYFERSLEIIRQVGEPLGISGNLNNLGVVAVLQKDYPAAEAYYQESLSIRRKIGDRRGIADTLMNLGTLAFREGNYQTAEPYHRESLGLHRELDDGFVNSSRAWLARTLIRLDRFDEMREL
ncbi:MAG: tetratricopeptide repeat protein, partial [Chloroflexota bacterium]